VFLKAIVWMIVAVFVVLYPMLISVYVFLPLLVGFAGLMIIRGIEGKGYAYIFFPLVYLLNLEINLSLPLLLTLFATLLYYLILYRRVMYLKRCRICVSVLSVVLIDLFYLGSLLGYDMLMDSSSIVFDDLLWYSLIADIVLAVL
jgi:hypothetical protein